MHIGLVVYGSLDTVSGGYLYDRKLVAYLRERGEQVEMFSLPWRGYTRHLFDNLSLALLQRLRAAPLDALLQDELNHPSLFWLNRALAASVDYPLLSIVHHLRCSEGHSLPQSLLYRAVERAYLRTIDGFVYNSETTRAEVERLAGRDRPSVTAPPGRAPVAPAFSEAQIRARSLEPGPLRLLFLGNLIPRKGLHHLLAALARLPGGLAHLTIVGDTRIDPVYTASIRAQISHHDLDTSCEMAGYLPDEALFERLARSQVLVVPSAYEGFGIAYLQGMGFGLPAIASAAGGAGEIVREGETGYLVPPGAVEVLAGRLRMLAQDRPALARMGVAARRAYMRHPTWHETARRIHDFVRAMVEADR